MNRLGIESLNAGAPDLRLSGDQTQRGTYVQRRRAQMAGGGIMGSNAGSMLVAPTADGSRPGYGWLDKIADLIPNELKDPVTTAYDKLIPNELKNPVVAAVAANYLPSLIPGGDATILEKLGKTDILGPIIGPESMIGRGIEKGKEILEPVTSGIGSIIKGPDDEFQLSDILGIPQRGIEALGGLLPEYTTKGGTSINYALPMSIGAAAGLAQQRYLDKQPPFPGDETGIRFQTAQEAMADPTLRFKPQAQYANVAEGGRIGYCLLYTSPSPRDRTRSRMPSSA